jgi:sec-independent protein translocase protein TatC
MVESSQEDDLFQHTAMTFGEHLEELRNALFKAVIALMIGFGIGLYFGFDVVQLIQSPLEGALETYYKQEAIEYIDKRLPAEMRHNQAVYDRVLKEGKIPSLVYVSPRELLAQLEAKAPGTLVGNQPPRAADDVKAAEAKAAGAQQPQGADDLAEIVLWRPLSDDERMKIESFAVEEPFVIYIKASLLSGTILAAPFMTYFLWSFVAAGLYPHEKRYVHVFMPISVGLFLAGVALAFLFVFPPVLRFFFGMSKAMNQGLQPRISEWLSFVLLLPLCFGIAFQLPLLMLFLERINIFSTEMYRKKWRIAVLTMSILAMVLSPGGDPISMMYMFVPLVLLYFAGIGLCLWLPNMNRNRQRRETKELAAVD